MRAIDLFAGAGGWTEGAEQAGAKVLMAINHWSRAVETHAANHPNTIHRCQDLGLMNPAEAPAHDLLLASPSCKGHTRARGKEQAHHDAQRATAWCVVNFAETHRPKALLVENVIEMREWELFGVWRAALERLGYQLEEHVFCASEFGVAQERTRLFVSGGLGGAIRLKAPGLRGAHAREIVRWDEGRWSSTADRAARTMTVLEDGRQRLGGRFLVPYFGNTKKARSADRPVGTLTTRDRYAVVDGDRMRMLSVQECRVGMDFPDRYILTGTRDEQMAQLGNAVCPGVARSLVGQVMEAAA